MYIIFHCFRWCGLYITCDVNFKNIQFTVKTKRSVSSLFWETDYGSLDKWLAWLIDFWNSIQLTLYPSMDQPNHASFNVKYEHTLNADKGKLHLHSFVLGETVPHPLFACQLLLLRLWTSKCALHFCHHLCACLNEWTKNVLNLTL